MFSVQRRESKLSAECDDSLPDRQHGHMYASDAAKATATTNNKNDIDRTWSASRMRKRLVGQYEKSIYYA